METRMLSVDCHHKMMRKCQESSLKEKIAQVLFSYRVTPQTTTGLSTAELLQGGKLRCSLDVLHPGLGTAV